jgi:SAM-dependent MidA family methyltransferase
VSDTLKRRLVQRISETGPITFADFMDFALYDSAEGFYQNPPIGPDRHFVTSPHVSPAFGDMLARQLAESWETLGRPDPFAVVEVGAGDGTLARRILKAVGSVPALQGSLRYVAVERSSAARDALAELDVEVHASLTDVAPRTGCLVANELLDNLPFHRLRERGGRIREVMVGTDGEDLIEVEAEPTPEAIGAIARPLSPGEERPVSPASLRFVGEVAATLARGYAFLLDFGFRATDGPGPVHAYRHHRVIEDVLQEPGSRDITAAVDLEAVASEAARTGLTVWGGVSQQQALLALGFRLWLSGLRQRQAAAERVGDWREANRLYGERSGATVLIDPDKLGALQLLALATPGLPPPAAVLGDRERGC